LATVFGPTRFRISEVLLINSGIEGLLFLTGPYNFTGSKSIGSIVFANSRFSSFLLIITVDKKVGSVMGVSSITDTSHPVIIVRKSFIVN